MKKFNFFKSLFLGIVALSLTSSSFGQLANGSLAPNWTMTDINGNSHSLYTDLAAGKRVVIDFSAVWCGPCWTYHNSGALENLYTQYGPTGTVNQTMRVYFIEADENSLSCLQGVNSGCSGTPTGNWTTGTPYPMFLTCAAPAGNGNTVNANYNISYFPTVYTVCPDHTIYESGQKTTAAHYSYANTTCAPLSTNANDVKAFSSTSPSGMYCTNSVNPNLTIQNYGTANLTSCTILVKLDGATVQTINWTGNLAMYATAAITISPVTGISNASHTLSYELTNPNGVTDQNLTNNVIDKSFTVNTNGAVVHLDLLTDNYPTETSWDLKVQGTSTVLVSGGSYSSTQHHYLEDWCLNPGTCYTFTIYDEYGDGMSYGGVTGSVTITYNGTTLSTFLGSGWTTTKAVNFCVPATSGISDSEFGAMINLFPNPSNGNMYITQADNSTLEIIDVLGNIVFTQAIVTNNEQLDLSGLSNGSYIARITNDKNVISKNIVLVK